MLPTTHTYFCLYLVPPDYRNGLLMKLGIMDDPRRNLDNIVVNYAKEMLKTVLTSWIRIVTSGKHVRDMYTPLNPTFI